MCHGHWSAAQFVVRFGVFIHGTKWSVFTRARYYVCFFNNLFCFHSTYIKLIYERFELYLRYYSHGRCSVMCGWPYFLVRSFLLLSVFAIFLLLSVSRAYTRATHAFVFVLLIEIHPSFSIFQLFFSLSRPSLFFVRVAFSISTVGRLRARYTRLIFITLRFVCALFILLRVYSTEYGLCVYVFFIPSKRYLLSSQANVHGDCHFPMAEKCV